MDGYCLPQDVHVGDYLFDTNLVLAIKKSTAPYYYKVFFENEVLSFGPQTQIFLPDKKIWQSIENIHDLFSIKKIVDEIELFQITTQKGLLCAGYNNVIIQNTDLTLLCYELTTSLHPIATFIGATTYFTLLYLQAQNSKLLFKESNTDPILDRLYSIYQYKRSHLESLKTEYENLNTLFSVLVSQSYELQQTLKLIFSQKNILNILCCLTSHGKTLLHKKNL